MTLAQHLNRLSTSFKNKSSDETILLIFTINKTSYLKQNTKNIIKIIQTVHTHKILKIHSIYIQLKY